MTKTTQTGSVSQLLQAWGRGDLQARENLVPLVYQQLRKRAAAYLRQVSSYGSVWLDNKDSCGEADG